MKARFKWFLLVAFFPLMACAPATSGHDHSAQAEPERITVAQVLEKLAQGEKIVFVDTRNDAAWGAAESKIPNAIRVGNDEQLARFIQDYPKDSFIVAYCT